MGQLGFEPEEDIPGRSLRSLPGCDFQGSKSEWDVFLLLTAHYVRIVRSRNGPTRI